MAVEQSGAEAAPQDDAPPGPEGKSEDPKSEDPKPESESGGRGSPNCCSPLTSHPLYVFTSPKH